MRYDEEKGRVYINETSYFEGVRKDVWEYEIGAYQVCRRWLEDRKGRRLTLEETRLYFRILTAIEKTMEVQKLIDELYTQIEEDLLDSSKAADGG